MANSETFYVPKTLAPLGSVQYETLMPVQQPTRQSLLISADTYQQVLLKYPERAVFHSYAEFIHGLWLESRRKVSCFVPQPFLLKIQNKRYTPDCYYRCNGHEYVVELKAPSNIDDVPVELLTQFFAQHDMIFLLIPNEQVLRHETLALHWLRLVQVMVVAKRYGVRTDDEEDALLHEAARFERPTVGDLLSSCDRASQSAREIALYRLIHRHRLVADLTHQPLDYNTELRICI